MEPGFLPILEAAKDKADEAVALAGSGLLKNMFLLASSRCCKADLSMVSFENWAKSTEKESSD